MKVLVLSWRSISDIIFSTPLIRALKVQTEAQVHFATSVAHRFLLEENPYIDKVITVHQPIHTTIQILRKEKYDHIIDLQRDTTSFLIRNLVHGKARKVTSLAWERFMTVRLKLEKMPNQHVVDRFLSAADHLSLKEDELGLDYFYPEHDDVPRDWLPDVFQKEYVVVALPAQYQTRKLPTERLIELCDRINKPIVLLGYETDSPEGNAVEAFFKRGHADWDEGLNKLNKKAIVVNLCGKFSLNQMASVIRKANYVFTYDSDFVALASAFKRSTFIILGNTVLSFGRYPYKTRFTVLENNKVSCRPCSETGYKKCPLGHFKCMKKNVLDFYLP